MKYLNTKPGSIEEVVANMSKHQNESGYQDMFKKELEKAGKGIGAMTPAEKKAFFNKIDDKYKAKNEDIKEAVDNPYAVGMAVAKKMKNDEPPLKKSTITKAHDIAKSIKKDQKESVSESMFTDTKNDGQGKSVSQIQQMLKREIQKGNFIGADKYTIIEPGLTPGMKQDMTIKYNDLLQAIKKHGATGFRVMPMGESIEKDIPKGYHKMPDGTIMKDSEHKKETHTFMTKDMNKSKKDAKGEKEIVDPEPKLKKESIQDTIANVWKMSAEELEKIKTEAKYMKAQRMSQYKAGGEKNKKGTADTGSKMTKVEVEPKVDYKN